MSTSMTANVFPVFLVLKKNLFFIHFWGKCFWVGCDFNVSLSIGMKKKTRWRRAPQIQSILADLLKYDWLPVYRPVDSRKRNENNWVFLLLEMRSTSFVKRTDEHAHPDQSTDLRTIRISRKKSRYCYCWNGEEKQKLSDNVLLNRIDEANWETTADRWFVYWSNMHEQTKVCINRLETTTNGLSDP